MGSKGLRAFASGLFIATAVIGSLYLFTDKPNENNQQPVITQPKKPSVAEMIEELENEGYVLLTAEEANEIAEQKSPEKVIYHMVLTISQGMSSLDVAEQLERGHIITNQDDFLAFIEENDLTTLLQTGDYELNSELTIAEVASVLTK